MSILYECEHSGYDASWWKRNYVFCAVFLLLASSKVFMQKGPIILNDWVIKMILIQRKRPNTVENSVCTLLCPLCLFFTPCLEYAAVSAVSNAGNPCAWSFFHLRGLESCGEFFYGLRPLADSVCAQTFLYLSPLLKPAQMQDSRAQTNWARTNAGLTRTNGHSVPDSAVSTHNYAPIVGRILQTRGTTHCSWMTWTLCRLEYYGLRLNLLVTKKAFFVLVNI
jgi:hypothetical protein